MINKINANLNCKKSPTFKSGGNVPTETKALLLQMNRLKPYCCIDIATFQTPTPEIKELALKYLLDSKLPANSTTSHVVEDLRDLASE